MQVERSHYEPLDKACPQLANKPWFEVSRAGFQPQFSFELGWNEPPKWWKPYICTTVWRWRLQVGWLWADAALDREREP
jgi:hypothetical protein